MFALARNAMHRGLLSRRQVARFAVMEARFVLSRSERRRDRDFVTSRALELVRGRDVVDVIRLATEVADELVQRQLIGVTVRRLRAHQAIGDETWLVTASAVELAEPLARMLGMTGVLATRAEVHAGVYSGSLLGGRMHGLRKAEAIRALAWERNLDLSSAFSYSDSVNDVPLLCAVGNAAVVNANRQFARFARARGWLVLRAFRENHVGGRKRILQPDWIDVVRSEFALLSGERRVATHTAASLRLA